MQKNQKQKKDFLKLISDNQRVVIPAASGSATIIRAHSVFRGYISKNFKNWKTNKKSKATKKTLVEVHKMIYSSTLSELFSLLSSNIDDLCLTQAQIINFCKKENEISNRPHWISKYGYGTFFLFKVDQRYFFVEVTRNVDHLLYIDIKKYSDSFFYELDVLEEGQVYISPALYIVTPKLVL